MCWPPSKTGHFVTSSAPRRLRLEKTENARLELPRRSREQLSNRSSTMTLSLLRTEVLTVMTAAPTSLFASTSCPEVTELCPCSKGLMNCSRPGGMQARTLGECWPLNKLSSLEPQNTCWGWSSRGGKCSAAHRDDLSRCRRVT